MEEILRKMLEAHRMMKHEFMNHLQVLSGYIQLEQPEKAREYIKKVSGSLDRFKCLAKIEAPFLQSLLVYYLSTLGENDCFYLDVKDWISLKKEEDRDLTLLLEEVVCPVHESVLLNELKCSISIAAPTIVEIGLWGQDRIDEREKMMKELSRLGKIYPRYSLAVMDKGEDQGLHLLITGNN